MTKPNHTAGISSQTDKTTDLPLLIAWLPTGAMAVSSVCVLCVSVRPHLSMMPLPSASILAKSSSALVFKPSSTSCLEEGSGMPAADRLAMLL